MICGNRDDDTCQSSSCKTDDSSSQQSDQSTFNDTMVSTINNLIKRYSNFSYTINNTDINSINDNYSNKCIFEFNYTDWDLFETVENGGVCCFDSNLCENIDIVANYSDVYCDGDAACGNARIANASNLVVGGYHAAGWVKATTNMALCQSYIGCEGAKFNYSRIVLCEGYQSCQWSTIRYGETIIALGYQSLLHGQIKIDISNHINSSSTFEIYLLGYDSANSLSITVSGSNNTVDIEKIKIYCQNDACTNIHTKLLCQSQNSIGISVCTLATQSPTTSPTYIPTFTPTEKPTESQLDIYLNNLRSNLNNAAIILALILFVALAPVLIIISAKTHHKNHSTPNANNSQRLTLADHVGMYGANASHSVIFFLLLEIYDIYTDIAYLIQLFNYKLFAEFVVFLSSMGLSMLLNMIIVIHLLKFEFSRNYSFLNWFYRYNGIVLTTLILLAITDANMIPSVITSQIFGHSAFYSPISIDAINDLQISLIFSLLFEHLPQLGIQIYLIFNSAKYVDLRYDAVSIAALTLSCLDVIFVTFKIWVWIVIKKNNSNKSDVLMDPQEHR